MSNLTFSEQEIDYLLSPTAIRDRSRDVFNLCQKNESYFSYHEEQLGPVVDFVLDTIKNNYPDLKIPFHSRWGHFKVGDRDRLKSLSLSDDKLEKARSLFDLVITSVLLDAGAGPDWKYLEDGAHFNRSEGLAVASFHMFKEGQFSDDNDSPFRADAKAMSELTEKKLEDSFQVSDSNPLYGVSGRVGLIKSLGKQVGDNTDFFKGARLGGLVDYIHQKYGTTLKTKDILTTILHSLGPIWPGRISANNINLGDVWHHSKLGSIDKKESLVVFHKLSQWLTYSLVEPLEDAGFTVTDADELTGLAEYRNGGLLIDKGLLSLKDEKLYEIAHKPSSELIIEWRALTIYCLDLIGDKVRDKLGFTSQEFPLAKVLEGGTWWAGRIAAKEKRKNGTPPLKLASDGTVF